jgi:adenine C2-methylase RlmN of 23S rRNA A2503 and tRNA A37
LLTLTLLDRLTPSTSGFAAVMEAMRDSGKPAVGHNLSFDLAFSLHSYAEVWWWWWWWWYV